ncbi:DNA-binding protein Alba [Methanococcus aeolicus]|uniref:DNA/RNA-binding protein Alba n=1 Tax=Methanococcus aeolicus (strain ATCC BAA-1280 / DSM 17508 / OCM 812 / Nankai-3) TaxID=419665 RepID=A6UWM9_META3|nr:DNA-binding protein Alba [Methanococcus aeolicus]ABR56901.1 DNA-binding protein Alba [Methanococcus aeolicus Nankai-3]UXM84899.1 DNA-binding protein Alba [Methanococcus aeolicus]
MDGIIYIGNKGVMNYVLAVITQINNEDIDTNEIRLKARGRAISKAVDVEEMLKNKFMPELKLKEVIFGTEEVENNEGRKVNVSTIEIVLSK